MNKIYILGESEGEFEGGCGRILNKMLMDVGIVRSECRIGYVLPPSASLSTFYTDKQLRIPTALMEERRKQVIRDIRMWKPNVVCALGNEAMMCLFLHRGVTNWRGSVMYNTKTDCKVIPTIHPSMIMKQWDFMPLALFDLRRVREESETATYTIPHRDFILAPTFEQTMCELERISKCKKVAFDIETSGTMISAVAFADSPFSAISIPFTFSKGVETINYFHLEEEVAVMKKIKEIMENEHIEKIAQNAQFDCSIFAINPPYINVRGLVLDTMCAHHSIYPELPKALSVLCSIYTRQPYYKHWIHEGDDVTFWKYNGMDACVTYESAVVIEKEMEDFAVKEFYYKFVHPLIPILMDMQIRGVRIDEQVREEAKQICTMNAATAQSQLEGIVGRQINVLSPKQLKQLLYVDMKLPVRYNRMSGTETTNEEALEALAIKYPSPIFDLILCIRRNNKLIGTYLTDEGGRDGRIRCSYVIGGTETGRLSSRESIFGSGTNLQNIPKGVCRRMFIPDSGKLFVEADLSQAEARVVAYLSQEERLIELFERKEDVYKQVAKWIGCEREIAKRLVHASNYGIGVVTFAHVAGVRVSEARLLLQKYFDTFPSIKQWQLLTQAALSKSRIMCTPMGRKRMFFGRWGEQLFREAYAYVPQSTVADVLNYAMIRFNSLAAGEEIMLQVHDAFVVQTPISVTQATIDRIKEAFNIPVTIKGRTFVIPVDIKCGNNWDEMLKERE